MRQTVKLHRVLTLGGGRLLFAIFSDGRSRPRGWLPVLLSLAARRWCDWPGQFLSYNG
jgi:hypothetical protein